MTIDPVTPVPFRWRDGERWVVFGRDAVARAEDLLEPGYALLTTERAADQGPELVERAGAVHQVGSGRVDELAGELRGQLDGSLLVALGGGRVIDVAKALAAADPPRRVAAVPTTLSGAEMTAVHRHAAGVAAETPRVRPAVVVNDPGFCASQPVAGLAHSAGNALGHALEGPATPLSNPVAEMAALAALKLIAQGFAGDEPDNRARDALALGALLAGYAIGTAGYGLHHVLSQTLARFAGVGHGPANTIMLPHTWRALAGRNEAWRGRVEAALDADAEELAVRLRGFGGIQRLRDAGVSDANLELCVEQASQRPELEMTPPRADVAEIRQLYRAAY